MKLTRMKGLRRGWWVFVSALIVLFAGAQGVTTTTVQGTVYMANGQPGSGTLQVNWPAFTTASNQAIAAGRTTVSIGADGFVSVNLAPNQGATPAGLYYTAVYHLSDGTTSTEYWVVPSAAQASLGQVRAQVMPAAQAVQTVSKTYVDQSIQELTQSLLTASGGNLSGPLYLNGDPLQPTQAATKHYVDQALGQDLPTNGGTLSGPLFLSGDPSQATQAATKQYVDKSFGQAVPMTGGVVSGALTGLQLGAAYQVDQFAGAGFGAKLQACLNGLSATYGGTCDARNFTGNLSMSAALTVGTANATVQLPCATISTAFPIVVTAGTRNVTFHGCALRGASAGSGSQGGTVLLYSGAAAAVQVGDATYAADTLGFHMDNLVINTTASQSASAQALAMFRTQEISLANLYLLGSSNQTGMTLDGTGNYTGGTFEDLELNGFQTAVNGVGHQVANSATTDWVNASTFVRVHVDCPLSSGSPVGGTYGINLVQGDGNTFTGGDIEGCGTALHLGPNAQNNTIVGLRNENSINQVVADAGSAYNNWITGGTMFTGQLVDNGTRNSFLDTFHRSFNGLNGDWYGSQQDATVTNHYRIGIGMGNERGYLNRYQTDAGYRWTTGLSDATAGEQFYQVLDELNSVYRLSIGQYNNGQASTNNQTVINAAGTGAIVLNGSTNAGTGGVIFGSGGSNGATVATINNAGNAQFNGSLQVGGASTFTSSTTVKNGTDAEIDAFLWAGATANQKESYIYKDYTGASQWYMVKDASNNWALNSATGGLDSIKAYQSTNSGDTYVNASNSSGHIRLNYETGAGAETDIYSGGNSGLVAAFSGTTAIKFPGLASGSGKNCLQIDNSGYLSNSGTGCGNGTVSSGSAGQVAVYAANGTTVAGASAVSVAAGGTGATSAVAALANLGAQAAMPGAGSDGNNGIAVTGAVTVGRQISFANSSAASQTLVNLFGALGCTAATPMYSVYANACVAGGAGFNGVSSDGNNGLSVSGMVTLGSDLATGHQAASANSAVTEYSVLAYGAVADMQGIGIGCTVSYTSGSANVVLSGAGCAFASTDVGKYVVCISSCGTTPPFTALTTTPSAPVPITNRVTAQITAWANATHVTLSKTASATVSGGVRWGTDNVPAINACITAAAASFNAGHQGSGNCVVPAGNYLLATAPYYTVAGVAADNGFYGTSAGGTGASITATVSGGQITGYNIVNGGSGYTPNQSYVITFSGGCPYSILGCMEYAVANANASGVISSITPITNGFGLTSAPTASIVAAPAGGGDGAAATVTVGSGSINSTSVTAGGAGYLTNDSTHLFVFAIGGGCTSRYYAPSGGPVAVAYGFATTNSTGNVTGVNWTQTGTNCTSAPTVIFGSAACNTGTYTSPVWGQCSNLAPLTPTPLPVQVLLQQEAGLVGKGSLNGQGASLFGTWDGVSIGVDQPAMLGGLLKYNDIRNLSLNNCQLGIFGTNNADYVVVDSDNFNCVWGMYTSSTDLGSVFTNLNFGGWTGWVNGGAWADRVDVPQGNGGFQNALLISNIVERINSYTATGVPPALDLFFNNNFWHCEYSALSIDFVDTPACPLTTNQRQTAHIENVAQGANSLSFRGIASVGGAFLGRESRFGGSGDFTNLIVKGAYRYPWYGTFASWTMRNWSCGEPCANLAQSADPWRTAAQQEGAIITDDQPGVVWDNIGIGNVSAQVQWALYSPYQNGNPRNGRWRLLSAGAANPQPDNYHYGNAIDFQMGLTLGLGTGNATQQQKLDWYESTGGAPYLLQHWYCTGSQGKCTFFAHDGITDIMDFYGPGGVINLNQATNATVSLSLNSGTAMTANQGNGTKLQHSTGTVTSGTPAAFDANGNTVNATASNVATLFCTGGTASQYLAANGTCQTGGGSTTSSLTFSNSGSGAASGTTFNGSAPATVSYNTIGAAASNASTTVNGTTCALGSSCTVGGFTILTATNSMASDVSITTAGTFNTGPSVSLVAGTWQLTGQVTLAASGTPIAVCKLTDGTNIAASGESQFTGNSVMTLSGLASPTSTTSWYIACETNSGAVTVTMKATTPYGALANASTLSGVKVQ